MGKKCCVPGCHTSKLSVYRFPRTDSDAKRWEELIFGEKMESKVLSRDAVVCELHWPKDFETVTVYGKKRPKLPPSILPLVNQMDEFKGKDSVDFTTMKKELLQSKITRFIVSITAFLCEDVGVVWARNNCQRLRIFFNIKNFISSLKNTPSTAICYNTDQNYPQVIQYSRK